ncbi:hypothetical protein BC834DRAFT_888534 [Gloeopeniophorella convolvens]|nr:hypothetical protein BC834DRAFT_888534 [Gloeopeniophorella convolvens]
MILCLGSARRRWTTSMPRFSTDSPASSQTSSRHPAGCGSRFSQKAQLSPSCLQATLSARIRTAACGKSYQASLTGKWPLPPSFFQSLAPALRVKVDNLDLRTKLGDMDFPSEWQDRSEPEDWRNLLEPFSNVKKLQVPPAQCLDVSRSLMSNGAQASLDLLPGLQTLELRRGDDDGKKAFANFIEERGRTNRPVSVKYTGFY